MLNPHDASRIVVLTGAGISAESGLATFRDSGGLWEGHRVEDVATPDAFISNPALVHQFYNLRRRQLINDAQPNPAHRALAAFEREYRGEYLLVTQNVDNLHELAGSAQVLHMHGELLKARCELCQRVSSIADDLNTETRCSGCSTIGSLRPHIVWFGEYPMAMERIESALKGCELFVAIGTSGQVYPAAGFVQLAGRHGAKTVELNLEPSDAHSQFDFAHYGAASVVVREFFGISKV